MHRRQFNLSLLSLTGCSLLVTCSCHPTLGVPQKSTNQAKNGKQLSRRRPQVKWKLFTDARLGFAARFPSEPSFGTGANFVSYLAFQNQHQFVVNVADNNAGTKWTTALIDQFQQGNSVDNKTLKKIVPDILEYQGAINEQGVHYQTFGRAILTPKLLYFVVVRTPSSATMDVTLAQKFFSGFKTIPQTLAQSRTTPRRGVAYITCGNCRGAGRIRQQCFSCGGSGMAPSYVRAQPGMGMMTCSACFGRGYNETLCYSCGGTGAIAR